MPADPMSHGGGRSDGGGGGDDAEAGARWMARRLGLSREDTEDAVQDARLKDHLLQRDLDLLVEAGTDAALACIDAVAGTVAGKLRGREPAYRFTIGVRVAIDYGRRVGRSRSRTRDFFDERGAPAVGVEAKAAREGGAEARPDLKDVQVAFEELRAGLAGADRAIVDLLLSGVVPAPGEHGCWEAVAAALNAGGLVNRDGDGWAAAAVKKRFGRLPRTIRDWLHVFA